jgi:phosphatidate cytidylyltransferase
LIGKNIGKTPLAPKISPNKTVEGFIGGLISTVVTSIGISFFYPEISVLNWIVLALIVSIFGVLGDLLESYFKRKAGVKDSANAIPGHGGFLDRLDSFILAAPFTYLFLTYIF